MMDTQNLTCLQLTSKNKNNIHVAQNICFAWFEYTDTKHRKEVLKWQNWIFIKRQEANISRICLPCHLWPPSQVVPGCPWDPRILDHPEKVRKVENLMHPNTLGSKQLSQISSLLSPFALEALLLEVQGFLAHPQFLGDPATIHNL